MKLSKWKALWVGINRAYLHIFKLGVGQGSRGDGQLVMSVAQGHSNSLT